ncbi:MAG TPA: hypothetical protein PK263_04855, partial [bacterium]|nr:hypothetical protein [bacterium]
MNDFDPKMILSRKKKKLSFLFHFFGFFKLVLVSISQKISKFSMSKTVTPDLVAGTDKKTAKVIDATVEALRKKADEIEALDMKIIRLQQSGRTNIKALGKIHLYLSMRSKLYHRLHSLPYASHLNVSALIVFLVTFSFSLVTSFTNIVGPKISPRLASISFIKASNEDDTTLFIGTNDDLKIGFSNKDAKTVGANIVSTSDRIPNAENYQISINLLADGLSVPEEKTLGEKNVSALIPNSELRISNQIPNTNSQMSKLFGLLGLKTLGFDSSLEIRNSKLNQTIHAQDSTSADTSYTPNTQTLPSSTVANAEVIAPSEQTVIYRITPDITVRYRMDEAKVKEFITFNTKDAINSNTLSFALNQKGLTFAEDDNKDGSWLAYREEDKDKI